MVRKTRPEFVIRVGARIRQLRKQRTITVNALAEAIGGEKGMISRIETGKVPISLQKLQAVAAALSVEPWQIVAVDAAPPPVAPARRTDELIFEIWQRLNDNRRRALLRVARALDVEQTKAPDLEEAPYEGAESSTLAAEPDIQRPPTDDAEE
jgi:transcriptional regulator with XRE-family HTH domain